MEDRGGARRRSCARGSSPPSEKASRRIGDRRGVDAEMGIEVAHRAGLAEMLDAEGERAGAGPPAEPGERRRMAVDGGDEAGVTRQVGEQRLNVACRVR